MRPAVYEIGCVPFSTLRKRNCVIPGRNGAHELPHTESAARLVKVCVGQNSYMQAGKRIFNRRGVREKFPGR